MSAVSLYMGGPEGEAGGGVGVEGVFTGLYSIQDDFFWHQER